MKRLKRAAALFLTLCMTLALLPTSASAAFSFKPLYPFTADSESGICVTEWDFNNPQHGHDYYRYLNGESGDFYQAYYANNYYIPTYLYRRAQAGDTAILAYRPTMSANYIGCYGYYVPSVYLYRIESIEGEELLDGEPSFYSSKEPMTYIWPYTDATDPHIRLAVPIKEDAKGTITIRFRLAYGFNGYKYNSSPSYRPDEVYQWTCEDFVYKISVGDDDNVMNTHDLYLPAGYSHEMELAYETYCYNIWNESMSKKRGVITDTPKVETDSNQDVVSASNARLNPTGTYSIDISANSEAIVGTTQDIFISYPVEYDSVPMTCTDKITVHIIAAREQKLDINKKVSVYPFIPVLKYADEFLLEPTSSNSNVLVAERSESAKKTGSAVYEASGIQNGSAVVDYRYLILSLEENGDDGKLTQYYLPHKTVYVDITDFQIGNLDLKVSKSVVDKKVSYTKDDEVTYTITVTNNADEAVEEVSITDNLPTGLTFESATLKVGEDGEKIISTRPDNGQYSVEKLDSKQSAILTITAIVDGSYFGTITNEATVQVGGTDVTPADGSDPSVSIEVPPVKPEESELPGIVNPSDPQMNDIITVDCTTAGANHANKAYTMKDGSVSIADVAKNNNRYECNVALTTLEYATSYSEESDISKTHTAEKETNNGTLYWDTENQKWLEVNDSWRTINVTCEGGPTVPPDYKLEVTKTNNAEEVPNLGEGSIITYTITVKNKSTAPIYDLEFEDKMDPGLSMVTPETGITAKVDGETRTIAYTGSESKTDEGKTKTFYRWTLPGELAKDATVTITYQTKLSLMSILDQLTNDQKITLNNYVEVKAYGEPEETESIQQNMTPVRMRSAAIGHDVMLRDREPVVSGGAGSGAGVGSGSGFEVPLYTVTYKNGETPLKTVKAVYNGEIILEAAPEAPADKVFGGWSDGSSTYQAGSPLTVTGDITLIAVWTEKEKPDCTVTFMDGEETLASVTVKQGERLGDRMPADPEKSGFRFLGWGTNETDNEVNFGKDTPVNYTTTVYAKWEAVQGDSDIMVTKTVSSIGNTDTTALREDEYPEARLNDTIEWIITVQNNSPGYTYTNLALKDVLGSLTLDNIDGIYWDVEPFVPDDEEFSEPEDIYEDGENDTIDPAEAPEYDSDGENVLDSDLNGSTEPEDEDSVAAGESGIAPVPARRVSFGMARSLIAPYSSDERVDPSNFSLAPGQTAVFTVTYQVPANNTAPVLTNQVSVLLGEETLGSAGAEDVDAETVTWNVTYRPEGDIPADWNAPADGSVGISENYSFTVEEDPASITTDSGTYTFSGWMVGETPVGGKTITIASDTTITGTWTFTAKKTEFDVTLNAGSHGTVEGQPSVTKTVNDGDTLTLPAPVPNPGYRFTGWEDDNGNVYPAGSRITVTGDMTLTARWEQIQYTVTFYSRGSVYSTRNDYVYGQTLVLPSNPGTYYSGNYRYEFAGWSPVPAATVTGNATYTALFNEYYDGYGEYEPPYYPPQPQPQPPETDIPDSNVPQGGEPDDGEVDIDDGETPLANTLQLNKTDHFAYIKGYEDNTVRPMGNITREEVATIFYRLLTDLSRNIYQSEENSFADVDAGRWSNEAISTLANAGVLNGYPDGSFKPAQTITRAEFAAIVARFDQVTEGMPNPFSDTAGHWAENVISFAASQGWVNGYPDGTFQPERFISRGEAMTLVNNVLEREVDDPGLLSEVKQWPDNNPTDWFYYEVLEATNSHSFERRAADIIVENWMKLTEDRY